MNYNLNSGYGQDTAGGIFAKTASGGRSFIVAPTAHPFYSQLQQLFRPDTDGVIRLYNTLAAAIAAATASQGDVIYLAEGYTETIIAAAGSGVTKAGLQIIGLGTGSVRPTFTFTTAVAASFDVTAANVFISNCVFTNGIDAQTAMINVNKADVTFDNCDFNSQTATTGAILGILTAATATRLTVTNSRFNGVAGTSGGTVTAHIQHEAGVDYVIRNNIFTGKCTQAILNVATVLRGVIDNNRIVVGTGTAAITMAAASTPFITNNVMNVASGTTPIVAGAGFVGGNVYSAAAGVTAGTAKTI